MAAASGALVQWLDSLVARVEDASYDQPACENVLRTLCRSAEQGEAIDFDSARQLAWAITTIWHELDPPPGDKAAAEGILDEMAKELRLDLPWGQARKILDPAEQQAAFTATTHYDPNRFRQQAARLSAALGGDASSAR